MIRFRRYSTVAAPAALVPPGQKAFYEITFSEGDGFSHMGKRHGMILCQNDSRVIGTFSKFILVLYFETAQTSSGMLLKNSNLRKSPYTNNNSTTMPLVENNLMFYAHARIRLGDERVSEEGFTLGSRRWRLLG